MPQLVGPQTFAFGNGDAGAGDRCAEAYFGEDFCTEQSRGNASKGVARRHSGRPARAFTRAGRRLARELHSHHSQRVMTGMIGLLALCGAASGKTRGTRQSLSELQTKIWSADCQPHAILRDFGAKPLPCSAAPELYAILLDICVRAGMMRLPELFLLPAPGMNAFALGAPRQCLHFGDGGVAARTLEGGNHGHIGP